MRTTRETATPLDFPRPADRAASMRGDRRGVISLYRLSGVLSTRRLRNKPPPALFSEGPRRLKIARRRRIFLRGKMLLRADAHFLVSVLRRGDHEDG